MIELSEQIVESELRHPAPRRVRMCGHALLILVASLLLLTAFGACGIAALSEAGRLAVMHCRGHRAIAVVTEIDLAGGIPPVVKASKWNPAYAPAVNSLAYRFPVGNGRYATSRIPISATHYDANGRETASTPLLPGTTFPILYTGAGAQMVSRPYDSASPAKTAILAIVGLAAMAIGVGLCWRCIDWVLKARNLIQTGDVAIGTVLGKESTVEDASRFYVSFSYATPDDAIRFRRIACSSSQYQRIETGQTLTVIYPPSRPGEAIPYALLPFGR
ncbi:MAG: DUF3592 domain-containing protein [Capsulimonadaceae bacterium]|nr:DUF3592 domain-containing protein [Capsulimonadaceae bacterium]